MKNNHFVILSVTLFLLLFSFIFSVNAFAQTTCSGNGSTADLACGLIDHWTFEDGLTSQTAIDTGSSPNTGTLSNGAVEVTAPVNTSITPSINIGTGAVNFPNSDSRVSTNSDFIGSQAVTVCSWFNSSAATEGKFLISNNKFAISIGTSASGSATGPKRLFLTSDGQTSLMTSTNAVIPNTWTYLCATRNNDANGTANFYINGELTNSGTSGVPTVSTTPVAIGNHPWINSAWDGELDDVRVYNRILSASEISSLYASVGGLPALTVISNLGTVAGTITSADGNINCGTNCVASYQPGTIVTLVASANEATSTTPAYNFTGWTGGGCSGTGPCTLNLTLNTTITANYAVGPPLSIPIPAGSCNPTVTGTTITACSCNQADVQNAINLVAQDGFTVAVPAGTCDWTQTVTQGILTTSKAMIIKGAGEGQTVIVDSIPNTVNNGSMFLIQTVLGKPFRLTGFTLQGDPNVTTYSDTGTVVIQGYTQNFRIDHNDFEDNTRTQKGVYVNGYILGVIDDNIFNVSDGVVEVGEDAWGGKPWGDGSWDANTSPLSLGTNQAVYIESNHIVYAGHNVTDGYAGARFVLRYNTIDNTSPSSLVAQCHGIEGGQNRSRGTFSWEIYNNVTGTGSVGGLLWLRSGTGVVFNNNIQSNNMTTTLGGLINYRSEFAVNPWSECDGASVWDVNAGAALGASGTANSTGTANSDVILMDNSLSNPVWLTNQWAVGYTIINTTKGWSAPITSNTDVTISTVIPSYTPPSGQNYWDLGDRYEIVTTNGGTVIESGTNRGAAVSVNPSDLSNSNWTTEGAWAGYSIYNSTQGWGSQIITNTIGTNPLNSSPIYIIMYDQNPNGVTQIWNLNATVNNDFDIYKANACMDQVGRSSGDLLTPDQTNPIDSVTGKAQFPNEKLAPVFIWNNHVNGQLVNTVSTPMSVIQEGREYYSDNAGNVVTTTQNPDGSFTYTAQYKDDNGTTQNWTYTPYTYPHPLTTSGFTAGFPWSLTTGPSSPLLLGDVNGDGQITMADAELTAQAAVGMAVLTAAEQQAAEVSSATETKPTIYDAYLIAEYVVGVITQFPVGN